MVSQEVRTYRVMKRRFTVAHLAALCSGLLSSALSFSVENAQAADFSNVQDVLTCAYDYCPKKTPNEVKGPAEYVCSQFATDYRSAMASLGIPCQRVAFGCRLLFGGRPTWAHAIDICEFPSESPGTSRFCFIEPQYLMSTTLCNESTEPATAAGSAIIHCEDLANVGDGTIEQRTSALLWRGGTDALRRNYEGFKDCSNGIFQEAGYAILPGDNREGPVVPIDGPR